MAILHSLAQGFAQMLLIKLLKTDFYLDFFRFPMLAVSVDTKILRIDPNTPLLMSF